MQHVVFMPDMLWTAPEILIERNQEEGKFVPGTPKGDVYSFAIIVQEMLYRNGTFFVSEENQPSPKGDFVQFRYSCCQHGDLLLLHYVLFRALLCWQFHAVSACLKPCTRRQCAARWWMVSPRRLTKAIYACPIMPNNSSWSKCGKEPHQYGVLLPEEMTQAATVLRRSKLSTGH